MSTASDQVKRLLFLVPYVAARKEGVPVGELAELLGCTRGELLAEIDLACRVGPPLGDPGEFVLVTVEDGRVFADLPQGFVRPPRLTTQEAFALLLGAQALADTEIEPYAGATARAVAKLRRAFKGADAKLLAQLEEEIRIVPDGAAGERGRVVPTLARAVRQHTAVEIDYYSAGSGKRKWRGVDPYGLINGKGSWYLVGRCHVHDETRIFKAERVGEVRLGEKRFVVPADFDLDVFAKSKLKLPLARKGQVRLRFHGEAARQAAGWEGAKKTPSGAVELSAQVPAGERLAAWVMSFGGDCEAVAPDELRAAVRDRLAAVAARHA